MKNKAMRTGSLAPALTNTLLWCIVGVLVLAGCDRPQQDVANEQRQFRELEWTDLMPHSLADLPQLSITDEADDPYQQALVSTKVIPEMDGQDVRIPGFMVPLEFEQNKAITEFFLVPYFGACIHVPPPPPNQILYVTSDTPLDIEDPFAAFWLNGKLRTTLVENDLATAAYTMELDSFELYTQ